MIATSHAARSSSTAFLFDLDGTLTRQELLPLIAAEVGLEEEMRLLTRLTIAGQVPFEASFRMRFAMLRSVDVARVRAAVENVELDPALASFISDHRDRCFVATGNLRPWIEPLTSRLGCEVFCNEAVEVDGRLVELEALVRKSEPVHRLRERFDRIVAIGDGANDMPMFESADVGVAFGGVHPPYEGLMEIAQYATFSGESLCRLCATL